MELWPFENFDILNFSARYLKMYLYFGLETSSAEWRCCVDELINVCSYSVILRSVGHLKNLAYLSCRKDSLKSI